jgi:choline kinase
VKAVIYAAGRGVRLGADSPKVLLEFAGRSLLEWHAIRLAQCGVRDVVVVVGHLREQVEAALPAIARRHHVHFATRVNERFSEGSILSLAISLPELEQSREPMLLMDADVLYPTAMLQRLIQSPHRTALLLDRNFSTADDDPVLVPVKDGRPFDFRKQWSGEADIVGESIGFFKIAPEDVPMLAAETAARSGGAHCRDSYDDALRALVVAGRFGYEDVTEMPWTEIDFPGDVVRAREEVMPAIQQKE